jgi:hypothetical protein
LRICSLLRYGCVVPLKLPTIEFALVGMLRFDFQRLMEMEPGWSAVRTHSSIVPVQGMFAKPINPVEMAEPPPSMVIPKAWSLLNPLKPDVPE